jgi:hypothetical protein
MGTLRDGTTLDRGIIYHPLNKGGKRDYLFVDVLQWSIGVLAIANTMTSHTRLAGVLFALDQHVGL